MGWFSKKADPIQSRAHQLDAEIAALESKIKKLSDQLDKNAQPAPSIPRLRPSVPPSQGDFPHHTTPASVATASLVEVDLPPNIAAPVAAETPAHYNPSGVRKFDLISALQRFRKSVTAPEPTNPKLVTYLAAGNIHGLRPLRHEKRVARNRFIVLSVVLLGILFAIFKLLVRSL